MAVDELWITFLDVGWGDSILIQARDASGDHFFGLVDSNDTSNWPTTRVFLKRFFERHVKDAGARARSYPFFDAVLASHAHADHVNGLQGVIRQFGTDRIYTPR
jgi:beta-lactamase superfamily II metal-dependent hydrolase